MLTQLAPSIATRHRSAEQLAHDTNRFTGGISLAATILPGAFDLSRRRHAAAAAASASANAAGSASDAGSASASDETSASASASSAPSAWPAPRTHLALSSHALRRNAGDMLALCAEVMAEARASEMQSIMAIANKTTTNTVSGPSISDMSTMF
jgi:hypothetical protein